MCTEGRATFPREIHFLLSKRRNKKSDNQRVFRVRAYRLSIKSVLFKKYDDYDDDDDDADEKKNESSRIFSLLVRQLSFYFKRMFDDYFRDCCVTNVTELNSVSRRGRCRKKRDGKKKTIETIVCMEEFGSQFVLYAKDIR